MREPPAIPEAVIRDHARQAYGLAVTRLAFLPLGADADTAAYRAEEGEAVYFLKLRLGNFEPTALEVPQFLFDHGLRAVIPPVVTLAGRLWSRLGNYACALYPFCQGQDGWSQPLADGQWRAFGAALRQVHRAELPPALAAQVAREDFSPRWREAVRGWLAAAEAGVSGDPAALEMAAILRRERASIDWLLARAGALAERLRAQLLPFVLCHADVHAGNLLLAPDGGLYIVDWDNPIHAPKERDLMFIGGGVGGNWNTPREEALFYQGYGPAEIHRSALAYYRCERILVDIHEFCQQVLGSAEGGADRAQALRYFASNFEPGGVLAIARETGQ